MDPIISFEENIRELGRSRPKMGKISQFAVIDPRATIGTDVEIGPFCVIGPDVSIGHGTVLENNVTIKGRVTIGKNNRIHPGVVIGGEPQDIAYDDSPTAVVIGDNNVIRECVTINRATTKEDGVTSIGNNNFLMACVHVAHDCKLSDNIVIANSTLLGGHVHIHENATLSGGVAIHHFVSVGSYSFIAGLSRTIQDVPPYMLCEGMPAKPRCVNIVALKRKNFSRESIRALTEAYRLLFRSRVGHENAREILENQGHRCPELTNLFEFLQNQTLGKHGRGRDRRRAA